MKRYCVVCDKKVTPVKDGKCPKCGTKIDVNIISEVLIVLAYVVAAIAVIEGFVSLGNASYDEPDWIRIFSLFIPWVIGGIASALLYGIAEIIRILNDIRSKLCYRGEK